MAELRIVEEVEDFPTHRVVTVKHLNDANELVRQDIRVEIKEGALVGAQS